MQKRPRTNENADRNMTRQPRQKLIPQTQEDSTPPRPKAAEFDNHLTRRAGRQGDRGQSKFFLSLEDDLMRIFGSKRLDGMLQKLGIRPEEAISHPWVSKAIEKAQKKVEEQTSK